MAMEIKETQKTVYAELAWSDWTDEQQAAMQVALNCMIKLEQIEEEANEFYEEELDFSDFGERVLNII